jgi:hypothetical protein
VQGKDHTVISWETLTSPKPHSEIDPIKGRENDGKFQNDGQSNQNMLASSQQQIQMQQQQLTEAQKQGKLGTSAKITPEIVSRLSEEDLKAITDAQVAFLITNPPTRQFITNRKNATYKKQITIYDKLQGIYGSPPLVDTVVTDVQKGKTGGGRTELLNKLYAIDKTLPANATDDAVVKKMQDLLKKSQDHDELATAFKQATTTIWNVIDSKSQQNLKTNPLFQSSEFIVEQQPTIEKLAEKFAEDKVLHITDIDDKNYTEKAEASIQRKGGTSNEDTTIDEAKCPEDFKALFDDFISAANEELKSSGNLSGVERYLKAANLVYLKAKHKQAEGDNSYNVVVGEMEAAEIKATV